MEHWLLARSSLGDPGGIEYYICRGQGLIDLAEFAQIVAPRRR